MNRKYLMEKTRENTIKEIFRKYEQEPAHAEQVARLALLFFDKTKDLHNLSNNERDLLEAGAFLHDIGYYISANKHHKNAMFLIDNEAMPGFSSLEKEIIANIARYHKGKLPKNKHDRYSKLSENDKAIVNKLGGILRIADALDRSHNNIVEDMDIILNSFYNNMTICLKLNTPECSSEIIKADEKKNLFEKEFDLSVKFITM